MTRLGWLCALAAVCLPLHALAQPGEAGLPAQVLPTVSHAGAQGAAPGGPADAQAATEGTADTAGAAKPPQPPSSVADDSVDPEGGLGRGLKASVTPPIRWPDDLSLPPNRPDPVGLRASPDALPQPISGLASWYADHFHGRRTASGELYSRHEMTAAHRDLPLGTLLHVSNPETGTGVVVRVNDRGPFHGDRVLDVSRAAASALGLVGVGVGQVDIRLPSSEEAAEFARRLAEAAKRPAPQPPQRRVVPAPQRVKPLSPARIQATQQPAHRRPK